MQEGLQFEIWLESFYKSFEIDVLRNVHIYRPPAFRQADLLYTSEGATVLVEAKHRFGQMEFDLRKEKKKKGQRIANIINHLDETYERKLFVKADVAILITNSTFSPKFELYCPKDIILINGKQLEKKYKEKGGIYSLNDSIHSINIENYYQKPLSVVVNTTAPDYISQRNNNNYRGNSK